MDIIKSTVGKNRHHIAMDQSGFEMIKDQIGIGKGLGILAALGSQIGGELLRRE